MQPSTDFISATTAVVILALLASAGLELIRPLPPLASRESVPVTVVPVNAVRAPVAVLPLAAPPASHVLENRRLREASDCVDSVTSTRAADFESCLQIYGADFPGGTGFTMLYQRRDARINLAIQAAARAALWTRLADAVAEDERASSPGADHAVGDALSQVQPIAGSASDEQRRLLEKAEPIARAFVDSVARRGELRVAAQHWGTRSGIDYENYAKPRGAITVYDHRAFSADDQSAWETLDAADALVGWSTREINAANRAQLPVALVKRNPAETDYGLARAVADDLASAGYGNIVKNAADAAVMIELSDIRKRDDATGNATRKHAAYDEAEYQVKFG